MFLDARSIDDGAELTGDLCVIGGGPAGIAIVERLRRSGLKVILVEGGGLEPKASAQELYDGENVGHRYLPLHTCRFRLFGGSSNRWGGWSRPLEPLDFEQRDWVPWSGWPIGAATLEPYYGPAAELLQLSSDRFDLPYWAGRLPSPFHLGDEFGNTLIQYSPQTNFGEVYRAGIFGSRNVTALLNASVTGLRLEPGTHRVGSAAVATGADRDFTIRARAFVLATGGIENPRLLLASRADRPAGLGNENGLVGRFFMEHLHVPAGHLVPSAAAADRSFYESGRYGEAKLRGFIAPTADAQRRHRLLSCFVGVEPPDYPFGTAYLGWPPEVTFGPIRLYRRLRRTPAAPVAERAKIAAERAFFLRRRAATWSAARQALGRANGDGPGAETIHSLYFRTEQAPDPASRVSLGDLRDRFGVPQVRLDWRVNPVDTASIVAWLGRLDEAVTSAGLGRLVMPREGWEEGIIGGPHHMGTTRMSASPAQGVVDGHCRVHSLDNLYVAGSSVFPTSGYANPTFTIVALAVRLADRLRDRLAHAERPASDGVWARARAS